MGPLLLTETLGGLGGRGLHCLYFELDADAVADEHAACFEDLVPAQPEVFAVDRRLRDEPSPLVAPGVRGPAAEFDLERHLAGHVADGEVTDDAVAVVRQRLDRLAAVAH